MTEFRLRECRERAGMTQRELSTLIGRKSSQQICDLEKGLHLPGWKLATDIAIALGCSLDELAGTEAREERHG